MAKNRRIPAVAGSFYPSNENRLKETIRDCFLSRFGPGELPPGLQNRERRRLTGLVCPHAGYIYSGAVAAHAYHRLSREKAPECVVIIGPNHTGLGPQVSIYPEGTWATPLGIVKVNRSLAQKIISGSDIFSADENAHLLEHSIEVQLPFLQFILGRNFEFVPICMRDQSLDTSYELGSAVHDAFDNSLPLIIASTDFSHYEPAEVAQKKDQQALAAILNLDAAALVHVVNRMGISMCGVGPVAAMITAARKSGADQAELLAYRNSGDVAGDYSAVVGYGAVAVSV